jgi:hypothetical protein
VIYWDEENASRLINFFTEITKEMKGHDTGRFVETLVGEKK